jgi:hypothetical protein
VVDMARTKSNFIKEFELQLRPEHPLLAKLATRARKTTFPSHLRHDCVESHPIKHVHMSRSFDHNSLTLVIVTWVVEPFSHFSEVIPVVLTTITLLTHNDLPWFCIEVPLLSLFVLRNTMIRIHSQTALDSIILD